MGFINKKQNIIDLALTSYGRELLSKGIISFDYFKLIDNDSLYLSSSNDFSIESLPVLEAISDADVYENQIFDGEIFISNYANVSIVNNISSCSIKRSTDDTFDTDSILSLAIGSDNLESTVSRIESLKNRRAVVDFSSSISFNRSWTNKDPLYLIQLEISSSDQKTKLFSSGSSFYLSEDNNSLMSQSSEINEANTLYEIVKIL
jgi:hypothetical protein